MEWMSLFPPLVCYQNVEADPPYIGDLPDNEPSLSYTEEINGFVDALTYFLSIKKIFPTKPITFDDPVGFVKVPVKLPWTHLIK